jgi:hypothetical protein
MFGMKGSTSLTEAEAIGAPLGTAGFVTELESRVWPTDCPSRSRAEAVAIPVGEQLNLLQ